MKPDEELSRFRTNAGSESDPVDRLVEECLDSLEDSGRDILGELCRKHPEHAESLRKRLERLRRIGLVSGTVATDPPADRLGEFKIIRILGRGGMGVVYLAEQTSLKRLVALKVMRGALLAEPSDHERFRREIDAVARLGHPSIVPIHSVGQEDGVPFYAMEYIQGASLADIVRASSARSTDDLDGRDWSRLLAGVGARAPSPAKIAKTWWEAAAGAVSEAARAVDHAHERGILHRDLKPSNIMVRCDGRAVLLDFGLATTSDATKITRTGGIIGSLPYLAPELLRTDDFAPADRLTDVYALGVTLYETLTLHSPYLSGSADGTRARILAGNAPGARRFNANVPTDLEAVCAKAMDPSRHRRYPTAGAFADDLDNVLAGRAVSARRPGPVARLFRWAERRPAQALAIGLGFVIVVGGPLFFALLEHRNAGKLKIAYEQAKADRERAELQRSTAVDAVDSLIQNVRAQGFAAIPELAGVRRRMLEEAAAMYEKLASDRGTAPEAAMSRADAWSMAGFLRSDLGDTDRAYAALAEAVAIYRSAKGSVDESERTAGLGRVLCRMGFAAKQLGRMDDASRLSAEAIDALAVVATAPRSRWSRFSAYVDALVNHALSRIALGDRPAALKRLAEAEAVVRTRLEDAEQRTLCLPMLAGILDNTASLHAVEGRRREAEAVYRQAVEIFDQVMPAIPDETDDRYNAVVAFATFARFLSEDRNWSEADRWAGRSVETARHYHREFPFFPRVAEILSTSLVTSANIHLRLDRREEAAKELAEARTLLEELHERYPEIPDYTRSFAAALTAEAEHARDGGRLAEAVPLWKKAVALLADYRKVDRRGVSVPIALLSIHVQLGVAAAISKDRDEAESQFAASHAAFLDVVAIEPRALSGNQRFLLLCRERATNLLALERRDDAEKIAEALTALPVELPIVCTGAAYYYCRLIDDAAKDDLLEADERAALRAKWTAKALAALERAAAIGDPHRLNYARDPVFGPLKASAVFQKLATEGVR